MIIPVKTAGGGYDIVIERGALQRAGEFLPRDRRVLIVTDDGVPARYAQTVAQFCKTPRIVTIPQGERSKCVETLCGLWHALTESGFTRTDCVVAVGGGVVGDLAGFAAACYLRGIDFYNVPTTVLSQVDSSIGGKTAIDFDGYKNIVGAFYQPRRVIIDPDTLSTLPPRQISNGLAEAVKMSLTCDSELFSILENDTADLDTVIYRSLLIKKQVVERDEKEAGLRKVLNFGHTLAHAVESQGTLYHGECVAIGMVPMCAPDVRRRLIPVLERLRLPTAFDGEAEKLMEAMSHDKKKAGDTLTVVTVETPGAYTFRNVTMEQLRQMILEGSR